MSLQFSDTTNKNGLMQRIERACGYNDGEITGNTTRMAYFTSDVNAGLNDVFGSILGKKGWQHDDPNHTKYPFITLDLVQSQRDYFFTKDEQGNVIVDIHKVMVADSSGIYRELYQKDQNRRNTTNENTDSYFDGQDIEGTPTSFDLNGSVGLFLDPVPSYNSTDGIKIFIDREASYFTVSDTTKMPGFVGLYHEYLVLFVQHKHALNNYKDNINQIRDAMLGMKEDIMKHYGKRSLDQIRRLTPAYEDNR